MYAKRLDLLFGQNRRIRCTNFFVQQTVVRRTFSGSVGPSSETPSGLDPRSFLGCRARPGAPHVVGNPEFAAHLPAAAADSSLLRALPRILAPATWLPLEPIVLCGYLHVFMILQHRILMRFGLSLAKPLQPPTGHLARSYRLDQRNRAGHYGRICTGSYRRPQILACSDQPTVKLLLEHTRTNRFRPIRCDCTVYSLAPGRSVNDNRATSRG